MFESSVYLFYTNLPPEPVVELTDVEKFQAYLPAVISVVVEETNENVENLSRYL